MKMKKIKLSKIPEWWRMNVNEIVGFMYENDFDILVNDYGYGLEFEVGELPKMWEFILKFKYKINALMN